MSWRRVVMLAALLAACNGEDTATPSTESTAASDDDDGTDDGDGAEQVVVAALDAIQDNDAGAAWSSLHPDEQNRTDKASFTQCVASQQLAPGHEREHRVTEVRAEEDPEVAGHTITGQAMRVTIEFWNSEAEIRGGGPVLDFYAIEADGSWRWADPHLDVANCARLPIE